MKKIMTGVLFVVMAATLTGCETMKGTGRDIQGGGRAIERAADKAK